MDSLLDTTSFFAVLLGLGLVAMLALIVVDGRREAQRSRAPIAPLPGQPAPYRPTGPLRGRVTRAEVEGHSFWQLLRNVPYEPDPAAIATLREQAADLRLLIFMGTWCGDTRRELPRLFRVLDALDLPEAQVEVYALDYNKDDGGGIAYRWSVRAVPTFVALKGDRELGRIVENPRDTLERDLAEMVHLSSQAQS